MLSQFYKSADALTTWTKRMLGAICLVTGLCPARCEDLANGHRRHSCLGQCTESKRLADKHTAEETLLPQIMQGGLLLGGREESGPEASREEEAHLQGFLHHSSRVSCIYLQCAAAKITSRGSGIGAMHWLRHKHA